MNFFARSLRGVPIPGLAIVDMGVMPCATPR